MKHGIRKVFLHPGDFIFGEPGTHVHTVLGSCIAICLWHPLLKIGGMCHFVLPSRPNVDSAIGGFDGHYGEEAMQLFDQAVRLHQTAYEDYQGKIFGGANMFEAKLKSADVGVGDRNAAKAKQLLSSRKVDIKAVNVGEQQHRRIVMDISTGNVWVRRQHTAE